MGIHFENIIRILQISKVFSSNVTFRYIIDWDCETKFQNPSLMRSYLRFITEIERERKMLCPISTSENIFFSDETHFYSSGLVNRQNCHYWNNENSKIKHKSQGIVIES